MNKQESDILKHLFLKSFINQRILSQETGHSLGIVNRSLKNLIEEGYLNDELSLTEKGREIFKYKKPKRAIILAAGYGMRMVPINTETPKGLIKLYNEPLIERIIKQLHEVGINEIYVVVGFMKGKYEYLIDKFGVALVVNPEYSKKNNLYSLKLVDRYLDNTYIIPCDIWFKNNPFDKYEMYSWYMVSDNFDFESNVRVNRKSELVLTDKDSKGNTMIGLSYLTKDIGKKVAEKIEKLSRDNIYDNAFWEVSLYEKNKMIVYANTVLSSEVFEINTYEQLREKDENSEQLKVKAIKFICDSMKVKSSELKKIKALKKGMTNRSFLFSGRDKKYIMRIPGEGTDKLINRKEEAEVYEIIKDKDICDNIISISSKTGYKITEYIENARVCDATNYEDVKKCMKKLREFHDLKLKVNHDFDIFKQINFYEELWGKNKSIYLDYESTKEKIFSLKNFIDKNVDEKSLTHIDAVSDNFLFTFENGKEKIRLIDWEYAGMQDPHVDIAMFCIYSMYDRKDVDRTIDAYFTKGVDRNIKIKIYCYIACCGLLWSNWCEYKRNLGVEFAEYSLKQYRYAKDYYNIVKEELSK